MSDNSIYSPESLKSELKALREDLDSTALSATAAIQKAGTLREISNGLEDLEEEIERYEDVYAEIRRSIEFLEEEIASLND